MAFALGALLCHQLIQLPDPLFSGLSPLLLPALAAGRRLAIPVAFVLGIAWTAAVAHHALSGRLPPALQGADLTVTGTVVGVPRNDARRLRFAMALESADGAAEQGWRWPGCRLRLTWYDPPPDGLPRAGERWRATVRLRQIRGLRNPGGYDAEHRAMRESVCATGYLRSQPPPARLSPPTPGLDRVRAFLAGRVDHHIRDLPAWGVVRALAVGLRDRIRAEHSWLLQTTGTAHLMAISGLHIGLVAGLGLLCAGFTVRYVPGALRLLPAAHWGALAGLGCAAVYAALAGFSVPTQRALYMLAAFVLAVLARRRCGRASGLALALALVLIIDPMAVQDVGTWLSFAAVAGLLWALPASGGAGARRPQAVVQTALRTQVAACLVLAPLAVMCFSYQSLAAPLANLLAVPVTGLVAVPLILLGLAADTVAPAFGGAVLRAGAHVMGVLLEALERIPGHHTVLVPAASPSPLVVAGALAGTALLLSPLHTRMRLLGLLWVVPLAMPTSAAPDPGVLVVQVVDVGQGLATVVRTARHVLVFDAGPRWGGGHDAGSHVLAPVLRREGIASVDLLIVSHLHADHAGGAAGLDRVMSLSRVLGDRAGLARRVVPCRHGQAWTWDGYRFRILHPAGAEAPGNNASCVLHVSGPGGSVLLPGDVEAAAEARLASLESETLAATVLVVPHHGSRTSSTTAFLDAVSPALAINSSGHRNRFRFPAREVTARYRARGIELRDTACDGQLRVVLAPAAAVTVSSWREKHLRFWHSRDLGGHCEP